MANEALYSALNSMHIIFMHVSVLKHFYIHKLLVSNTKVLKCKVWVITMVVSSETITSVMDEWNSSNK